jgi:predicted pyridoxine 5'-phosphate oxidase superfamily flavin-nucleotide-binding protein
MSASVFHEGEQQMQSCAGVRDMVETRGSALIRSFMPDQHRTFFAQLPFLIVGGLDAERQPWASVWSGPPGFAQSPDPQRLRMNVAPRPGDPVAHHLRAGAPIGLLGIEPHTRRRNRMNGTVVAADDQGYEVAVRQSFGNCPKYIQAREATWVDPQTLPLPGPVRAERALLSSQACAMVERSDTFFIASSSLRAGAEDQEAGDGVDVSHRGGKPGFVRVRQEGGAHVFTVPDFVGNNLFNTLGNITVKPEVGLLFIDFDTGDVLHLSGQAIVVHEHPDIAAFEGAQRLLQIRIKGGLWAPAALPLRWSPAQWAPQLAATGAWKHTDH